MNRIKYIVVHYSATRPDQDITAADVAKWHVQRGFRTIGYHWFIRRDGTLEEGRSESEQGAHVRGHNANTIGVCWAGGLGPDGKGVKNMTREQEKELVRLLRDLVRRHPGARVIGHRDLVATECPGFDVAQWWAQQGGAAPRTSPAQATTVQAGAVQAASGIGAVVGALGALNGTAQIVAIVLGVVVLLAAAWIMRERLRKWAEGDR